MSSKRSNKAPEPLTAHPAPKADRWTLRPTQDRRRPGKRLVVRDPRTNVHLSPEGTRVVPDTYWRRRLRDGDVEHCDSREG